MSVFLLKDVRYVPYTYTDPETHDTINTIRRNDERYYYINDHLGSVRAIGKRTK